MRKNAMCKWGDTVGVLVEIPAHLSANGQQARRVVSIDRCIAPLIRALSPLTIASCCGHGKMPGRIDLKDGRILMIYDESGLDFEEVCRQPYQGMAISGGFVKGHPVDSLYIRLERDGDPATTILLRPDEMAAMAWIASGTLWSEIMARQAIARAEGK